MIKIAFIYKPNNPYLCGLRPNNNFRKFYLDKFKKNKEVEVTYYGSDADLDCRKVAKHDVYLFFDTHEWGLPYLYNVDTLKGLKVASINDAHSCDSVSPKYNRTRKQMLFDLGIDYCYYQHTPDYFKKFYPEWKEDKYWWIPIGFDAELYKYVKPFEDRNGDNALLTGVLGGECYQFRDKCKKHPLVRYIKPGSYEKYRYKKGTYDGDNYKILLEQFKFAIASSYDVANKYFEIPAAGCICVAHVDDNNGCDIIGLKHEETAIIINDQNYHNVLGDILQNGKDCSKIAKAGRELVYEKYTHEKCVQRLVDRIKEVL